MNEYSIFIPGKPFGKQRPRVGKGFAYTPKETISYENLVKMVWIAKYGNDPIDSFGFYFEVCACFLPAKSTSKKVYEAMIDGKVLYYKKPDFDNLAKISSDALNGIAWQDDSQVVDSRQRKVYREYQGVLIRIIPIDHIEQSELDQIDMWVKEAEGK
jgi:Holliday junction resolvase RusA-like endonuclease